MKPSGLNHVYRVVWCASKGVWQAVNELSRTRTRNNSRSVVRKLVAGTGAALLAGGQAFAGGLPEHGQITAGSGSISQSGNHMVIDQSSSRLAINWQNFSIGADSSVTFQQPGQSAVALNRVVGHEQSVISGALNANGQVWLLNANGVLFNSSAQINTAGLVASTLAISDDDFMAGKSTFASNGSAASVINLGNITTVDEGYVALLGQQVVNEGVITARLGTAALAAGDQVTLNFNGNSLVGVTIDRAALNALVENRHAVFADGGTVILTAQGLDEVMATVVNNTGEIRAASIEEREGRVFLTGVGDYAQTEQRGRVDVSSASGRGGRVEITGAQVGLWEGAEVDASGATGGGRVLIGGDYQGANPEISNAQRTFVAAGASVNVDATEQGDGGTAIVWADESTRFAGHISARGGASSGDGGFAEVSGKQYLDYQGTADLRAPSGEAGTLLLDPTNITISDTPTNNMDVGASPFSPAGPGSVLSWTTIESALQTANLRVTTQTGHSAGEDGDITVASGRTYSTPYTLTLETAATGGVFIDGAITNNGSGGFIVEAGDGGIVLNEALTFVGGNVELRASGLIIGLGTITTTAAEDSGLSSGRVIVSGRAGVNFTGDITTSSSNNTFGQVGNAGQIIVVSEEGSVRLGDLFARGGDNTFDASNILSAGGSGGQGGGVNLTAAAGSVEVGDIDTSGGIGKEGVGGGGGTVLIRTTSTDDSIDSSIVVGTISSSGGDNELGGFNGGNAGNIRLETVFDDTITLSGDLLSVGGQGTTPSPQGLGGNIRLTGSVELSGDRLIDTGETSGNVNFDSTLNSAQDNTPHSLIISAGIGSVFFDEAIGAGENEARELSSLTVTGANITSRRNITARDGVTFTTSGNITLGDSGDLVNPGGLVPGVVINTNRDDGNSLGNGAITFNGRVRLEDHLTLTRGTGTVAFSTGLSNNITGAIGGGINPNLTVNGSGADGQSNQGHLTIGSATTAISGLGHISLSNLGNLTITGGISATSLIYENAGTGNVMLGSGSTATRTFSGSVTVDGRGYADLDGKDHGVYIETAGEIDIRRGLQNTQANAAMALISTGSELKLTDSVYASLTTNSGDVYLQGQGVSQVASANININANGGQIVVDGGGENIVLGGRLQTSYASLPGSYDPAVLLRHAANITVESVIASNGTLQFGTPSAELGAGVFDVTGNVLQSNATVHGISVRSIAANTDGNITITSTVNNFDELGLIELNGNLHVRSDTGGLSLTENVTAQNVTIETGQSALVIGNNNVTATSGNILLRGQGVTQGSGSVVDAGAGTILVDGHDIRSTSEVNGNIQLSGSLITTNATNSAVQVIHSSAASAGRTIQVGDIDAQNGRVLIGSTNYISSNITQAAGTRILANDLQVNNRGSITLNNDNEINDLSGVRYGGTVSIRSLDGLRLTGNIDRWNAGAPYQQVNLTTEGAGAALLDLNGRNINGNGVNLYGQGVQSSGGTVNGQGGSILVNAGGGLIDLSGATLRTTNTSNTAVQLLNAGDDVTLGNINTTGVVSGAGRLVLGGAAGLDLRGDVSQAVGSVLTVGSLQGNTTGAVDLTNNNLIRTGVASGEAGTLAGFTAGGPFSLFSNTNQDLNVTGAVVATNLQDDAAVSISIAGGRLGLSGSIAGDGVSLTAQSASGYLVLGGNIDGRADNINLVAGGRNTGNDNAIFQSSGTITTDGSLTGSGAGRVLLEQTNNLAGLGPFTTTQNQFVLNNTGRAGALTLTGNVATPNGFTDITTGGLLDLASFDITSNSGLITLRAIGITQGADSVVNPGGGNANELSGPVGGILLDAGGDNINLAGSLATTNTTDNAVRIRNSGQVILGSVNANSGRVTLGFDANDQRITGEVTQIGALTANTLEVFTDARVVLGNAGNQIGTLNPVRTVGDFTLIDSAGGLQLAGDVRAESDGNITIRTAVNSLQLGEYDVTAVGTGNIDLAGVGISSLENGAINAGSGTVRLDALNASTGAVSLAGTLTTSSDSDTAVVIQRASNVNFASIVTGNQGTVWLGSDDPGLGIAGNITQSGALQTGTLRGNSGNVVLKHQDNAFKQLGPYISSGGFDIYSSDLSGITFVGDVTTTGTTAIETLGELDLDTYNLLATGSTLNLTAQGIRQSTDVRVDAVNPSTIEGASTLLQAGGGAIDLRSENNNFTGQLTLAATGDSAQIRDRASLNLGSLIRSGSIGLGTNTGVTAIAGTTLSLAQESINTGSGDIDLRALGGDLQTVGSLSTTSGNINVQSSGLLTVNHALTSNSGDLSLTGNAVTHSGAGDLATDGNISVTASGVNGDITMVSGTEYQAGSGDITLDAGRNILLSSATTTGDASMTAGGYIRDALNSAATNVTANALTLDATDGIGQSASNNQELNTSANLLALSTDSNAYLRNNKALALGNVDVGNGVFSVTSEGALSQQAGATLTLDELQMNVAGAATLDNVGNTINQIGVIDTDAGLTLRNSTGALSVTGPVTVGGATQLVNTGGLLALAGDISAAGHTLTLEGEGVNQTGGRILAGSANIDAGAGAISLLQADNDFTGAVSLNNSGANDVAIRDANSLQLAASNLGSGTLTVTANGLSQSGAVVQAAGGGQVTFNGGGGAIVMDNANNNFTGAVSLNNSGNHQVVLRNASALLLAASEVGSGTVSITAEGVGQTGAFSQAVDGGAISFVGGNGNIELTNSGNRFTGDVSVSNTDAAVALTNDGQITLGDINTQTLNVTATGIGQNAEGLSVTGVSTFVAGAGAVDLSEASNNLGGTVNLSNSAGHNVSLTNSGSLELGTVSVGAGELVINAVGISQSGTIVQAADAGPVQINGGAGPITLAGNNDFTGEVRLSNQGANAIVLNDVNALRLGEVDAGGSLTVSADTVTVADDIQAAGSVSVEAGTLLATLSDTTITASGGFNQTGAGTNELRGAITTDGSDISFASNILLRGNVQLSTGASSGTVLMNGTLNSNNPPWDMTIITGDSFEFLASVGDSSTLGRLIVQAGGDITQAAATHINVDELGLASTGNIILANTANAVGTVAASLTGSSRLELQTDSAVTIGQVGDLLGITDNGGTGSAELLVGGELTQTTGALIQLGGDLHLDTRTFDGGRVTFNNEGANQGTELGNTLVGGNFTLVSNGDVTQQVDANGPGSDAYLQVGGSFTLEPQDGSGNPVNVVIAGNSEENFIAGGSSAGLNVVRLPGQLTLSMSGTELTVTTSELGFDPVVIDVATITGTTLVIVSDAEGTFFDQSGVDVNRVAVNLNENNSVNGVLSIITRGQVNTTGATVVTGIQQSNALALADVTFDVRDSVANTLPVHGNIVLEHVANTFSGVVSLVTEGGSANLTAAGALVTGDIDARNGNVSILASGALTQVADAEVRTNTLALEADEIAFDQHNWVDVISAATTNSLSFINQEALTVGVVGGAGVESLQGDILIRTASGDVTLANTVGAAVASGAAGSIDLVSAANLVNNKGAGALSVADGNWRVWSDTPDNDVLGGLEDPDFIQYDALFADSEKGSVLGSGNGLLYRFAPTLSVSLVGSVIRDYDGTDLATLAQSNFDITGIRAGDSVELQAAGRYDDRNVLRDGSGDVIGGKTVYFTPAIASASRGSIAVFGYDFASSDEVAADIGRINPIGLTVSGLQVESRAYDATTLATMDTSGVQLAGLIGNDDIGLSVTGNFVSANAGTDILVNLSSTYSGVDAGNYTIVDQTTALGTITPFVISLTGSRVYDGTTQAMATDLELGNLVGAEMLVLSGMGSLADRNAADGKLVNVSGLSLADGSGLASNYTLTGGTHTLDVTRREVTVSGITASDRIYDGTTIASVNASGAVFDNIVSGDLLTASATGTFDSRNVGTDRTVTLSSSYGGADVGNYTFVDQTTTTASITPRAISVSGIAAQDRIYDGSTDATVVLDNVTFNNLILDDDVQVSATGVFDSRNVGVDRTVTLSSSYSGADLANYVITDQATTTASITPRTVTISGITADDRVYDGSTDATVDVSGVVFGNLVSGDDLNITATGSFVDRNAGTAKTVNLSSSYGGEHVDNYVFVDQLTTTASITPRAVTVSGLTASDRVYDGTTAATVNVAGVFFDNIVSGDTLTVSATGTFDSRNVGTDRTVTLSSSYGGADVGNYTFVDQTATTASITPRAISVSGIAAQDRIYDGSTDATVVLDNVTFNNLILDDDVQVSATGVFDSRNVGVDRTVTLSSSYSGADLANYVITDQATTTASITPRTVTISGITADDRVYDGSTDATVDVSGVVFGNLVSGDDLNITATGSFVDRNAGTAKTVNLSSSYGGEHVDNYVFVDQLTTTASITPRAVTVSGITASDRVYDGTTDTIVDVSGAVFDNLVDGDSLNVTATGAFADRNAGTDKTVLLTNAFAGADRDNYVITEQATTTASITPRALTALNLLALDKVYDGTTHASINVSLAILNGIIGGDEVALAELSGQFAGRNVGQNITVTTGQPTLTGEHADNYTIEPISTLSANITPRDLAVTATALDKMFDGTVNASVTIGDNRIRLEDELIYDFAARFISAEPGQNRLVLVTDILLGGADAANYRLLNTAATSFATIRPLSIFDQLPNAEQVITDSQANAQLTAESPVTKVVPPQLLAKPSPQGPGMAPGVRFVPVNEPPAILVTQFGPGSALQLVAQPRPGEQAATVTLSEVAEMIALPDEAGVDSSRERRRIRVPLNNRSLVDIVDGGVALPEGVEQLMFVTKR